jgi:hypothetical protein
MSREDFLNALINCTQLFLRCRNPESPTFVRGTYSRVYCVKRRRKHERRCKLGDDRTEKGIELNEMIACTVGRLEDSFKAV